MGPNTKPVSAEIPHFVLCVLIPWYYCVTVLQPGEGKGLWDALGYLCPEEWPTQTQLDRWQMCVICLNHLKSEQKKAFKNIANFFVLIWYRYLFLLKKKKVTFPCLWLNHLCKYSLHYCVCISGNQIVSKPKLSYSIKWSLILWTMSPPRVRQLLLVQSMALVMVSPWAVSMKNNASVWYSLL